WPGKKLTETVTIDGRDFYYATVDDSQPLSVIFNRNGAQTGDITGITEDTYFEYNGTDNASKIDVTVAKTPSVKFSPNGGTFYDNVTVTATVSNAVSAWYRIGNGSQTAINGNTATFTLGDNMEVGESVTVSWSASSDTETKTGNVTFTKAEKQPEPEGITVYYDNSVTNWSSVKIHHWSVNATDWPGVEMTQIAADIYMYTCPTGTTGVVFNNGNGDQTDDVTPEHGHIYKGLGNRKFQDNGVYISGVGSVETSPEEAPVEYYNLQGVRVINPTPGIYIQRQGNKVRKIRVN
ncbi:MAG: starch-binding protein, partial [Muribaculaceae bacterium]|nr:starch-binding protein [Muribaculaceae bacterium]